MNQSDTEILFRLRDRTRMCGIDFGIAQTCEFDFVDQTKSGNWSHVYQSYVMGNFFKINHYETEEQYNKENKDCPKYYQDTIFAGELSLGDPADRTLTHYEKKYGIAAKKREIIIQRYCQEVDESDRLGSAYLAGFPAHSGWFRARNPFSECISQHWNTPGLEEAAINEYLHDRAYFRSTGRFKNEPESPKEKDTRWVRIRTYEEYLEDKDKSFWTLLKQNIFGRPEKPKKTSEMDEELEERNR